SGQSGVSGLSTIVATFNESLDPTSVNSSTFLVTVTATGAAVAGTVSFNSSSLQAIFIPTSTLQPNTNYTVTLTTGMKDAAGNALASNNVFTFTTAP
ncbi:MAG TPA: Ig-like domain-containing protein, partial [Gemmatimonadaceae bacterium]|nr:Ig-like domain-containing protein [Gemmatimonadaceae bacterium]